MGQWRMREYVDGSMWTETAIHCSKYLAMSSILMLDGFSPRMKQAWKYTSMARGK